MAYKYYTKNFTDPDKIDKWLNSFYQEGISWAEQAYEVVGYVVLGGVIIITIQRWEISNKKSLKDISKNGNGKAN